MVSATYDQPDLAGVLAGMRAQRHFTLLLAWRRYVDAKTPGKKYGYAQFCALFADYVRRHDLVATLHHEPGRAMLVDWAGDTIDLVDAASGEITRAVLFVTVLPYSGALFCRAYLDMKSPAWLDAHVRAFAFYGGVPQFVVPDNPTTSTHQRTRGEAERVVNARYQQLADHYRCAVVPARARKPRDKAAAENAVNVVNKRVIGYLEADVWTSLAELNDAIAERVAEVNHDLRRADGTTRWERFVGEEQALLAALPATRFEEVEWKELKAGRNYHITCDYQRYSVPYGLAGRLLRVRLTSSTVTVFEGHDIVCEHRRLTGRKGQYSTLAEHVPAQHQGIDGLWSRRWFTGGRCANGVSSAFATAGRAAPCHIFNTVCANWPETVSTQPVETRHKLRRTLTTQSTKWLSARSRPRAGPVAAMPRSVKPPSLRPATGRAVVATT